MTEVYFVSEHVTYYNDNEKKFKPELPKKIEQKNNEPKEPNVSENITKQSENKKKNKLVNILTKDLTEHISRMEKIIFTRHLVSLQKAGIPILESINIAMDEMDNKTFKTALQEILQDMKNGKNLSTSLSKHPKIFNALFISMIKVAEQNGRLPEILAYLLKQQEDEYRLITKVKGAMIYPVIIMIVILLMVTGMLTFVIPQISSTYVEAGIALPFFTRLLINISEFLTNYGIFIIAGLIILYIIFKLLTKQGKGKEIKDKINLNIPIYGKISQELQLTRLTHALSDLIRSGVNTDSALKTVSNVTNNLLYKKSLIQSAKLVNQGKSLTETLKSENKLYPHMMIQMGKIGEKTGKIDEMLSHISRHYEENVLNKTTNLSTLLEPVLLIIAGVLVGSIALAVLMPIWNFVQII